MKTQSDTPELLQLSLDDIASWQNPFIASRYPHLRAAVPLLQRGLVWSPQQIELLWDSLFRGFPIGSLVLCPRIDAQVKKPELPPYRHYSRNPDDLPSHHLLDGQQRLDAIAMGCREVFSLVGHEPPKVKILWIDLNPDLDADTTRSFLFRVTDTAHPWGYCQDDSAKPLPDWQVREALAQVGLNPSDPNYQTPNPHFLAPYQAKCPIPLIWLLEKISFKTPHDDIIDYLLCRLNFQYGPRWIKPVQDKLTWPKRVIAFLEDSSDEALAQREKIFDGVRRTLSIRIPGIIVPKETFLANRLESGQRKNDTDISNVQHIFQRLNRQGTQLDGGLI